MLDRSVWRRLLGLLFVALFAVQPAFAGADGAPSLRQALKSGGVFVLVVAPAKPGAAVVESEAYGDWAAQLAAFQARAGGVTVVTASDVSYRRLVARPALAGGFGTLFVQGGGRALVHPGMILDPFLYECGVMFLRGRPACREAGAAGMREVRLQGR